MYAIYAWLPSATTADVAADIATLLTGETVIANLSSSCDKPNSSIISTVPATWVLHDTIGSRKILKAPSYYNAGKDNFIEINVSSTTALIGYVYETFDNVTHTGTNKTANTNSQRIDLAQNGYLRISCNSRNIVVLSEYANISGDGYSSPLILSDIDRQAAFFDNSYPSMAAIDIGNRLYNTSYTSAYFTRIKNSFGEDLPSGTGKIWFTEGYFASKIFGTSINSHMEGYRIRVVTDSIGTVGYLNDIYFGYAGVSPRKEVTIGANTYIVLPCYSGYSVIVRKE